MTKIDRRTVVAGIGAVIASTSLPNVSVIAETNKPAPIDFDFSVDELFDELNKLIDLKHRINKKYNIEQRLSRKEEMKSIIREIACDAGRGYDAGPVFKGDSVLYAMFDDNYKLLVFSHYKNKTITIYDEVVDGETVYRYTVHKFDAETLTPKAIKEGTYHAIDKQTS